VLSNANSAIVNSAISARPQVLIVEDEAIVAQELKHRLTKFGYDVLETVASGEQAVRVVEEDHPDLVLMDIGLAGAMSGTDAAEQIRARFRTPVVYLTAFSDVATLARVKETEAYGYLTKPFQPEELCAVLDLALSRHQKENQRAVAQQQALADTYGKLQDDIRQFTYSAGHDLQEPLRTVKAYVELLNHRAGNKLTADERLLIVEVQAAITRMGSLLNDLLAYAQAGVRENTLSISSAEAALNWALVNLHHAIEESHASVTHEPLPSLLADPTQLAQVFQNLLGNAIKYRKVSEPPRIHIGVEKERGRWVFSVADNGVGFDPRNAERIFVPFKRLHTKHEYQGTGVGLAICKKIVEAHGGKIWAESEPGNGSTFRFAIPSGETD
jgi:two-component system, sensor histidine kinase and response regulator